MNKQTNKKNKKPISSHAQANVAQYCRAVDSKKLLPEIESRITDIESSIDIGAINLSSMDPLVLDKIKLAYAANASSQTYDPLWLNYPINKKILSLFTINPRLRKIPYTQQKEFAEYSIGEDSFDPSEAWIQTSSGKRFTPLNPKIKSITIDDIAHALSMQCRFTGHSNEFYSVAQHCVYVSYMCDYNDRLHGLLHDGSEAYICDFSAPLKRSGKFDNYVEVETKLQSMIYSRFGLSEIEPESVKYADKLMLYTEARDLIERRSDWESKMEPAPFKIQPLGPKEAKQQFLSRFYDIIIDMHLAKNK